MRGNLLRAIGFVLVGALLLAIGAVADGATASGETEYASIEGLACVDGVCGEEAMGSEVSMFVNGFSCGTFITENIYTDGEPLSLYHFYVPLGAPGCGELGAPVSFTINGRPASQTATLQVGGQHLDIYVGEDFAHYSGFLECDGEPCYGPCDYCPPTVHIAAYVNGAKCGAYSPHGWLLTGEWYGDLSVTCGNPGDTVSFTIDGEPANETAVWEAGFHRLDLSTGGDEFPSTTFTIENDTGQVVDGVLISAYPIPSFEILTNAPGCESPDLEYHGTWPHGSVTVSWSTMCVDPGESVEVRITMDCSASTCNPPGVGTHAWLWFGEPVATSFFGYACIDGDCSGQVFGKSVVAKVDGLECGSTETGMPYSDGFEVSNYLLTPTADCGDRGDAVEFFINGEPTNETATWRQGQIVVNLTTGGEFMHLDGSLSCNGGGCYDICDSCSGPLIKAYISDVECASQRVTGYLLTGTGYGDLSVLSDSQRADCGIPGAEVRFTVDGEPARETITWEPGFHRYSLSVATPERLWGDLDCDGRVTSRDAQGTLRIVLDQPMLARESRCPGLSTLFHAGLSQSGWGDWDCSGEIGVRDVQVILRRLVSGGQLSTGECELPGGSVVAVS